MTHLSEGSRLLNIEYISIDTPIDIFEKLDGYNEVCVIILPSLASDGHGSRLEGIEELVTRVSSVLGSRATLVTIGEAVDLVSVHEAISAYMHYQLWIAVKKTNAGFSNDRTFLPQHHFGALVHTKYKSSLKHTKTRIRYSYCPACGKTTKDYGGKKHTYHEYGTLMSDVWRDLSCDLEGDLSPVIDRFADLFGIELYHELKVFDCRPLYSRRSSIHQAQSSQLINEQENFEELSNKLILGDCLEELKRIPSNSIDFAFADPPYNLGKKYTGYGDDLEITEYFRWCDEWITELARVLKPGRTCAVLNIPLHAIRHFIHMEKVLRFQNWIVWDGLSLPVRMIMPAHYAVLCFSKGNPRELPGLKETSLNGYASRSLNSDATDLVIPMAEGYCLRSSCLAKRSRVGFNDHSLITDLWWDIHRLKHNSRRVDHPCLLPPKLMYRLIHSFTNPGETVLDCFNGAGTTTLSARLFGRNYIGIEKSEDYHEMSYMRHEEINQGMNPFRKMERTLTAKNSKVRRLPKRKYAIPKKTLQLEVKRVAGLLGKLPTRDELISYGKYSIKYYDEYFVSWGEVNAAARTTGMSENPTDENSDQRLSEQLKLFEPKRKYRVSYLSPEP